MTTFVRRVPDRFDTTYWRVASGYMERELGAVDAGEAVRHESPKGFVDTAGKASGQAKDQCYCFAPYDGLRGLGMPDFHESIEARAEGLGNISTPRYSGVASFGEAPPQESLLMRAAPYVVAAVGLLWLLNKTAKETAAP